MLTPEEKLALRRYMAVIGAKGGKARTQRKLDAVKDNAKRARAARRARRAGQ